nr:MAG TPA: transposase [Caudoviricetes sp.]
MFFLAFFKNSLYVCGVNKFIRAANSYGSTI